MKRFFSMIKKQIAHKSYKFVTVLDMDGAIVGGDTDNGEKYNRCWCPHQQQHFPRPVL